MLLALHYSEDELEGVSKVSSLSWRGKETMPTAVVQKGPIDFLPSPYPSLFRGDRLKETIHMSCCALGLSGQWFMGIRPNLSSL